MRGIKETIIQESARLKDEIIGLRRHFHKHPELSYLEVETAAYICNWLTKNDISFRSGIAGTGIIATLKGEQSGNRVIAVRAELDALPIHERNATEYASINTGVMHACGHDAHMAMLMGTARLFKENPGLYGGTLLLIFQPGEEKTPGGAKLMIASGELDNPKPDIILAQHILPELSAGKTGYRPGRYMASCDELYFTVTGTGGHAALPGMTTDQVYIASQLVVRLKDRMKARQETAGIPTVLGIGRIIGEGATNVIPGKVEIAGTFRTFDENWRKEALGFIRETAEETGKEYGVEITLRIEEGYPVLINDEKLTERAVELSGELLGKDMITSFDLRMSSDDFSYYSSLAPTLYYRIGAGKKGEENRRLHTADFDLDEASLQTGVANLSWLICNFMKD